MQVSGNMHKINHQAKFGCERAIGAGDMSLKILRVRFDAADGTLLLDLGDSAVISKRYINKIRKLGFDLKPELHVTILGFRQGRLLVELIQQDTSFARQIMELADKVKWSVYPSGLRYILQKEKDNILKQSIVEIVHLKGGADFITGLNTLTGASFYEQVPHVTLATKGDPGGIGIYSQEDLSLYAIDAP